MVKRKQNNNLKEYNEMLDVDGLFDVKRDKEIISELLPNDIKVLAKNESQKNLIKSIKNNEITICAGPAGCGKTYVALAYAMSLIRKPSNRYRKIYLVKSVTTLRNEEIGFLKGGLEEKINPFMWSYFINIEKLILKTTLSSLIDHNIIVPFPLAYMRGASLDDCIIIIDEAQNISLDNIRTAMTRIGSNSKMLILGDTNQIDMKNKDESSLNILLELFNDVESMGVVVMDENDTNVRNPIINQIENKFKTYYNEFVLKNVYTSQKLNGE